MRDRGSSVRVDGVAEAHDPLARRELAAHPAVDPVRRADLVERGQSAVGCAAVQRAGERAERGDDGGRQVGAGGGDDAGGERRGVEAVVDGGDEVALDGPHVLRRRFGAGDHVQPVGAAGSGRAGARSAAVPAGAGAARRGSSASRRTGVARPPAGWSGRRPRAAGGPSAAPVSESAVRRPRQRGAARRRDQPGSAARDGLRHRCAARPSPPRTGATAAGSGSVPSIMRCADVGEAAGAGQLDRGVLAVVVEALVAADVTEVGGGDHHAAETGRDGCRHGSSVRPIVNYRQY